MRYLSLVLLPVLLCSGLRANVDRIELQGKPALRILNTARDAGHKPTDKGLWKVVGKLEMIRKPAKDPGTFGNAYSMNLLLDEKTYPVKKGSIELIDALAEVWADHSSEKEYWKITSKVEVTAEVGKEADSAAMVLHAPKPAN